MGRVTKRDRLRARMSLARRAVKKGPFIIGAAAGAACAAAGMDVKETLVVVTAAFWGVKLLTAGAR